MNAHVSYRVSTEARGVKPDARWRHARALTRYRLAMPRVAAAQTSLPTFKWKQFSVVRRFRDFASLHQRLSDAHPGERPRVAQPY